MCEADKEKKSGSDLSSNVAWLSVLRYNSYHGLSDALQEYSHSF